MSGRQKVIVAMSGGIDSSTVAALLMREHEVVGVHIRKMALSGLPADVQARDDDAAASAERVAGHLGIPLRFVDAGASFEPLVDYFCAEYNAGRTPNPCVICNPTVKWRTLLAAADAEGARFVATGHYARIEERGGAFHLMRGQGGPKDQTYFLHRLTRRELARTLFPLADLAKSDVRRIAAEYALPVVERPESQEICFVGAAGYREILLGRTPRAVRPGEVTDESGRVLGRHEGHQFFTVGQRKGLRIALGRPAYVVAIDAETGRVTLGPQEALAATRLRARAVNWIVPGARGPFDATVRIRYNHRGTPARVTPDETGATAIVEFAEPVRAVTPGQAAVFYAGDRGDRGDECLGGGWIELA